MVIKRNSFGLRYLVVEREAGLKKQALLYFALKETTPGQRAALKPRTRTKCINQFSFDEIDIFDCKKIQNFNGNGLLMLKASVENIVHKDLLDKIIVILKVC